MAKFKVGEIHNPVGRPHGTGHRQQAFNALVMPHKRELLSKAVELALAGNEAMLRLFLERMMPAKPIDEHVSLSFPGNLAEGGSLLQMSAEVFRALANQEITPEQAKTLMAALKIHGTNMLVIDFEKRLTELEGMGSCTQMNAFPPSEEFESLTLGEENG